MLKPRNFVKLLLDNLGWGLASLALAVMIWYAASSVQNPVREERFPDLIPLNLTPNAGLIIVNKPPTTAQVTIRALDSVWRSLQSGDIQLNADLSQLGPGTHTVPIQGILSGINGGAIVRIQPNRITLDLAARGESMINVSVHFTSDPPVGYVAEAEPSQPAVKVSGAQEKVNQVSAVLARVDLQDQRASFSRRVLLSAVDAEGKVVSDVELSPADIVIMVDVRQRADVTELTVDPRFVPGTLSPGYIRPDYRWEPRRIFVRGDADVIAALNGIAPTEPIDLTGRTQTFTQVVKVLLPAGVTMPDPTDITVTVTIEPVILSREFADIPVQTQGLDPADYTIKITPELVKVIVTGPSEAVSSLKIEDIRVYAPLAGFSAGTHTITLQASVSKAEIKGEDVRILPNQAEVTVTARTPTATPAPTRQP